MSKIGVFGGSFDPVHFGHIYLARQAVSECTLDRLIVLPAAIQPFKPEQTGASGMHRLKMVGLAFEADMNITVSDFEIKKGGVSYTIDTLREIGNMYGGDTEVSFILGADTFLKIEKWKGFSALASGYSFIIGTRPGYRQDELGDLMHRLIENYGTVLTLINNRQIQVSSSEIKQIIGSGNSLSGFIPVKVERYIRSNGLYQ